MSTAPAVVPRWEWRTFGSRLELRDATGALAPGSVRESDETYVLSPGGASVKYRDNALDVKELVQVNEAGLEQWRPTLKAGLPLPADDVERLVAALGVTAPPLDHGSYGADELVPLLRACDGVDLVRVHKTRRHFEGEGCLAELTTVRLEDAMVDTVAIESEDPSRVTALVERLGFPLRPNVSMPRGLEELVRRPRPRFGVIDVGTNSVKLHVGERALDGTWTTVVDRSEVTRLGEGLDETASLQPDPMRRTLEAIAEMADEARRVGASSIAAVGTAGMRKASNAEEFVERVRDRTAVEIEVISGEEESRLAYLAVKAGVGLADGTVVVFDTGGGSSQFTFGRGGRVDERFSLDVGAVRFAERFRLDEPVSEDVLRLALHAIADDLARLDGRSRPDVLVALGGVVSNLAAVKHALVTYDPDEVQGTILDRAEVDRQIELYRTRTADERRHVIGLQRGRAEVILAGACIVRATMEKLGCEALVVSDRGLRHGLLLERFGEAAPA